MDTPDIQTSPEAMFKKDTLYLLPSLVTSVTGVILIDSGDKIQVTKHFTGFQSCWKLCRYMYLNLTVNYHMKLNHYSEKCSNTKTCSQHLPEQLQEVGTGTYIQEP